jgi:hypothetical protein
MQLKPIAAILVLLLLVASLCVAGCTTSSDSKSGTVSTDYPTSGRSELIGAAIEHQRNSLPSSTEFTVEWKNNTWAVTTEQRADGSTYVTGYEHWRSVDEASAIFDPEIGLFFLKETSASPTWYHEITGKWPTVSKALADIDEPKTGVQQYDALIVRTQLKNATTATETPTATPTSSNVTISSWFAAYRTRLIEDGYSVPTPFNKTSLNGKEVYVGKYQKNGRPFEEDIYPLKSYADAVTFKETLITAYKNQGYVRDTSSTANEDAWYGTAGNTMVKVEAINGTTALGVPATWVAITPIV